MNLQRLVGASALLLFSVAVFAAEAEEKSSAGNWYWRWRKADQRFWWHLKVIRRGIV
jgi:hypothetical protein